MSIGSIGGTSSLNQAYLSQQALSVLAASFDPQTTAAGASTTTAGGSTDASSNALTGVSTPTLDSQTLQALMDLTQQDPAASDPSSADGSGQASQASQGSQAQGAHHHHRHHGGGMEQAQASDPSPSQTATDTASAADAFGVPTSDADSGEDPLVAALSLA
jgi:hypothetical protein